MSNGTSIVRLHSLWDGQRQEPCTGFFIEAASRTLLLTAHHLLTPEGLYPPSDIEVLPHDAPLGAAGAIVPLAEYPASPPGRAETWTGLVGNGDARYDVIALEHTILEPVWKVLPVPTCSALSSGNPPAPGLSVDFHGFTGADFRSGTPQSYPGSVHSTPLGFSQSLPAFLLGIAGRGGLSGCPVMQTGMPWGAAGSIVGIYQGHWEDGTSEGVAWDTDAIRAVVDAHLRKHPHGPVG